MNLLDVHNLTWVKQIGFHEEMRRIGANPWNYQTTFPGQSPREEALSTVPCIADWLSGLFSLFGNELAGVDVIFYQAGADAHIHDPAGGYFTTRDMNVRDFTVFQFAKAYRLPVVWNLTGGLSTRSRDNRRYSLEYVPYCDDDAVGLALERENGRSCYYQCPPHTLRPPCSGKQATASARLSLMLNASVNPNNSMASRT